MARRRRATCSRRWALTDDEAALLPAREPRPASGYAALGRGRRWLGGAVGVRLAMDGWRFDAADAGIEAATGSSSGATAVATLAAAQDLRRADRPRGCVRGGADRGRSGPSAPRRPRGASLETLAAAVTTVAAPRTG